MSDSAPPWAAGPPLRAVIFDLDGTLLDTLEDIADAMNDALRELAMRGHALPAYRRFVGDGAQMLAARVVARPVADPLTIQTVYQRYLEAYGRRWHLKSRPYAGIDRLLDGCEAAGLGLAVLSNKADHFTRQVVERFLPRWSWLAVRGQRAGTPRKPAPDGALALADQMGVSPAECLFLGDSDVDVLCARSAGMWALGALWGFRPRAELEAAGAHALAATPLHARELILRNRGRALP